MGATRNVHKTSPVLLQGSRSTPRFVLGGSPCTPKPLTISNNDETKIADDAKIAELTKLCEDLQLQVSNLITHKVSGYRIREAYHIEDGDDLEDPYV